MPRVRSFWAAQIGVRGETSATIPTGAKALLAAGVLSMRAVTGVVGAEPLQQLGLRIAFA